MPSHDRALRGGPQCGWIVAMLCLWLGSSPARADNDTDKTSYSQQIAEAVAEYDAGRLAEARALFLRAHAMQPSARTLRGLGMVEFGLRHYSEASRLLSAALEDARNPLTAEQRAQVKAMTQKCSTFVGRYRVMRNPQDATVSVDGAPASSLEPYLLLDAGEHTLVVQAPGRRTQERHMDVKGGETEELRFELPENIAHNEPLPAAVPQPGSAEVPPSPAPALTEHHAGSADSTRPTWGWVSLGIAGAALAGGVVAWRVGEGAAARWNDDSRCLANNMTRMQNCGDDSNTVKTARVLTATGLITAGVLGVVATVLLWPRHEDKNSQARAACGVGPGEVGVACTLGF